MKILVATDQWSPDDVGGSARVAADTARALARRGHEVVVVTRRRAGLPVVAVEDGVEVHRRTRRGPVPQTFADPVETWRAARPLLARRFDVALSHQATNGAGMARLDIPHVAVFHASAVLEMRFLQTRVDPRRRVVLRALDPFLVALERRWLCSSVAHLVLSQYSAGVLRDRYPALADRIDVVGGGVDAAFFEPRRTNGSTVRARFGIPDGPLLFTARRLEPRMGVDLLVDALGQLSDPRIVLAVSGDGPERESIALRAQTLGLADRVFLLGKVREGELRALYAAADLFVLPTVAYEGFGMSTVEALAHGTPVLGTRVGATPEILSRFGEDFLVPEASAPALAAGIERLLPQLGPDLRGRVAALTRAYYAWDVAIKPWERALLRGSRG